MMAGMPFIVVIVAVGISPSLIIGHGDIGVLVRTAPTHLCCRTPVTRIVVGVITAWLVVIGVGVGHVVHGIDVLVARVVTPVLNGAHGAPALRCAAMKAGGVSRLAGQAKNRENGKGRR